MAVTKTRTGPPVKFDGAKVAKVIAAFVPGAIIRRTGQGIGSDGAPLAAYSGRYRDRLAKAGEDTSVDLRLTGGLLNSIKVRSSTHDDKSATVTIAPDTGTSPAVSLVDGRAKRTGDRGPPHNVLGWWIHHGNGRTPARPFMGLTPDQERELYRLLAKVGAIAG